MNAPETTEDFVRRVAKAEAAHEGARRELHRAEARFGELLNRRPAPDEQQLLRARSDAELARQKDQLRFQELTALRRERDRLAEAHTAKPAGDDHGSF
jgi:hypothetical protein